MSAGATRTALEDVREAPSLLEGMRAIAGVDAAAVETDTAETVRVLLSAILDPTDQLVAIGAVLALGGVRHDSASSALIALLREGPPYLRDHAAWALGGCELLPQALPLLVASRHRGRLPRHAGAAHARVLGPAPPRRRARHGGPGPGHHHRHRPRVHGSSRRWVSCPATRPSRCCGPSPWAISRTQTTRADGHRRARRPASDAGSGGEQGFGSLGVDAQRAHHARRAARPALRRGAAGARRPAGCGRAAVDDVRARRYPHRRTAVPARGHRRRPLARRPR